LKYRADKLEVVEIQVIKDKLKHYHKKLLSLEDQLEECDFENDYVKGEVITTKVPTEENSIS